MDGFALLLFTCELDRGLLGKLAVGNLLAFALLSAEGWPVGRVALRLLSLTGVGGSARSSCLVRQEKEPDARGAGCDRVSEDEPAQTLELHAGAYRYQPAVVIRREARAHCQDRTLPSGRSW